MVSVIQFKDLEIIKNFTFLQSDFNDKSPKKTRSDNSEKKSQQVNVLVALLVAIFSANYPHCLNINLMDGFECITVNFILVFVLQKTEKEKKPKAQEKKKGG